VGKIDSTFVGYILSYVRVWPLAVILIRPLSTQNRQIKYALNHFDHNYLQLREQLTVVDEPRESKAMACIVTGRLTRLRSLMSILLATTFVGCASMPASPPPRILLLGEVHDNPDGHQKRYDYLRVLVERGWRPTIVMEQFDRENQALLTKAQTECADADCVIRSAGGKGWEWPYYRPLIELALRYHLPLIAANVSRADAASVMKNGLSVALDQETIATYRLQEPLPVDLIDGQRLAIETGHCGKAPESMVQGMVNAQVARDVAMAQALRKNSKTGAVLIAGNGHVRRDIGVPHWLLAVGVSDFQTHGYIERGSDTVESAYDIIHFIAPHPRPDPCGDMNFQSKPAL